MNTKFKNKHLIVTGHQQIRVKDLLGMIKEILGGNIEIEFGKEEELHHYKITPYSYKPQVAIKVTPEIYYDLGQGLTDQIYDLQSIMEINNDNNKISLRKRKK